MYEKLYTKNEWWFSIVYEHRAALDPNPNKVGAVDSVHRNKVNTDQRNSLEL
jgi:hypothetical protein